MYKQRKGKEMKRQLVVYLVSLAAFLGPFTQTIYTPILPEVREAFATSSFLINFTISIFTFFLAMMQIVYGPLTDRKGRRTVLLGGIGNFLFLKETKPKEAADFAPFRLADFAAVLRHRAGLSIVLLGFLQCYSLYNFLVFLPGILTDQYGLSAQEKGTVYLAMDFSPVERIRCFSPAF
ncbi:hypothetical protein DI43_15735 [Geobacillus sp. CAMR12739]|nr:hypothetical protein DI43_15735 [Geobacillus sp. CAMR12739]